VKQLTRLIGVIFIVCCLLAAGSGTGVDAQRGDSWQYFPETGHTVIGEFWLYYQANPKAALVFGSPLTEQFTDTATGRLVQYFQRARFELYPEKPRGSQVVLSLLGPMVLEHTPPSSVVSDFNPLGCRRYASTGFALCYAFLEFFDRNGGEEIFGRPISAFVFYNGRIVQYFERARLDWYPENPEGQKVALAQLGRYYFDLVPEDPARLQPVRVDNAIGNVKTIQARVFAWKTMTRSNDEQVVYVVVQDQTLNPVQGATVIINIVWGNGEPLRIARSTNASGVVILPVPVLHQSHGSLIVVKTEVLYMGLSANSTTSFRIWQ